MTAERIELLGEAERAVAAARAAPLRTDGPD